MIFRCSYTQSVLDERRCSFCRNILLPAQDVASSQRRPSCIPHCTRLSCLFSSLSQYPGLVLHYVFPCFCTSEFITFSLLSGRVVLVLHYQNRARPFLHLLTGILFSGCSKTMQEVRDLYYLGSRINCCERHYISVYFRQFLLSILKHADHHYSFLCHAAATKHIAIPVMYLNSMRTNHWNVCRRLKSQQHGTSFCTVYS